MIAAVLNASSGIAATTEWMATTAGNIANANDTVAPGTVPYRAQTPVLAPIRGGAGTGAGGRGDVSGAVARTTAMCGEKPPNAWPQCLLAKWRDQVG